MKKFLIFILSIIIMQPVSAKNIQGVWHNDLRTLFQHNNAIIDTINIRTFNAKDTNSNEIIDEDEESGNFINAIDELDDLVKQGINTIHVLPITPVGKIKAFGTAGSLYAISSFTDINPQLVSKTSSLSGIEQAKRFIRECHKRDIRVIIDLPSCGSYDMFVEHPEYYMKDENQNPIIPLDWTDVRLLNCGTEHKLNDDLLTLHKKFIDMLIYINADGIRADVAGLKPPSFWKELIKYTREKNSEFLFLAESSKSWTEPVASVAICTPSEKLLDAGFDGYLGSYFNLKNWNTSKEFISTIQRLKKEGYQFVSIASALEIIKNKNRLKFAVVTFDDVPEDVYHNAYPYLNEHNIPFTLFVSQCYIDQPHFLTKDQIMEMDRNPLCTVGAHTLTHPFLRYSVNKGMELSESKRQLEELLGHEVLYMAYPYGKRQAVSHKIQRQAMRAGYRCAFGTINVPITDHTGKQLFYLPRVVIRN